MPNRLFYLNSLDHFISGLRGVWSILLLPCFIEISVINANGVDLDQPPRSDLGLHRLPTPFYGKLGINWLKKGKRIVQGLTQSQTAALSISQLSIHLISIPLKKVRKYDLLGVDYILLVFIKYFALRFQDCLSKPCFPSFH